MYYLKQSYCNKGVIFLIYTLIFICMLKRSHARFVHITLHNSETLESLTWIRVHPSYCYNSSLSFPLSCTHALYCDYWTSVNIRHSNQSLNLSFFISTYQCVSPYKKSILVHSSLDTLSQLLQYYFGFSHNVSSFTILSQH